MKAKTLGSGTGIATKSTEASIQTPAFVINSESVIQSASRIRTLVGAGETRMLYSIKALPLAGVISGICGIVDGYSAASLFEARLARQICGSKPYVGYTNPIMLEREREEICSICDGITLNSLSQLKRFAFPRSNECVISIRVNPGISFVEDQRDDPCREDSKLGVPLKVLRTALLSEPNLFEAVTGIHFHSNCDSEDTSQLIATIRQVESVLGDELNRFDWLNVGGGYMFNENESAALVAEEFQRLREKYSLEIVFEPGAAIVRSAGSIITTVEDILPGTDRPIAILDSTVNHWPELFEYQFGPQIDEHVEGGLHEYMLAGCSCLAGDLFGTFSFDKPLEIGMRVVFREAGAYSIVKAHMFNGVNLPTIYLSNDESETNLVKQFTYEDFSARFGVGTD